MNIKLNTIPKYSLANKTLCGTRHSSLAHPSFCAAESLHAIRICRVACLIEFTICFPSLLSCGFRLHIRASKIRGYDCNWTTTAKWNSFPYPQRIFSNRNSKDNAGFSSDERQASMSTTSLHVRYSPPRSKLRRQTHAGATTPR